MLIKRLNLSFDLSREIDRRAYEILSQQSGKTAYVSMAVVAYNDESVNTDIEPLKNALREVLSEFNLLSSFSQKSGRDKEEFSLPDEIFDSFNQL